MRKIQVVEYNPAWPELFNAESVLLCRTLGSVAIAILHIGSTAVPGLPAKPIIDILVETTDLAALDTRNRDMTATFLVVNDKRAAGMRPAFGCAPPCAFSVMHYWFVPGNVQALDSEMYSSRYQIRRNMESPSTNSPSSSTLNCPHTA